MSAVLPRVSLLAPEYRVTCDLSTTIAENPMHRTMAREPVSGSNGCLVVGRWCRTG